MKSALAVDVSGAGLGVGDTPAEAVPNGAKPALKPRSTPAFFARLQEHTWLRPRFLSSMSIRARLAVIAIVLLIAAVFISAIAWQALRGEILASGDILRLSRAKNLQQQAANAIDDLKADVYHLLVPGLDAEHEKEVRKSLLANSSSLHDRLIMLAAADLDPEFQTALATARSKAESLISAATAVEKSTDTREATAKLAITTFEPTYHAVEAAVDAAAELIDGALTRAQQQSIASAHDAKRLISLAGCIAAALAFFLVILINKSIRNSIQRMRVTAQHITAGDLSARCQIVEQDDLGKLGEAINAMATNLQATIGKMQADASRTTFSSQVIEALEMASTETGAYAVVERAMPLVSEQHEMELLISDSSEAHLERAAAYKSEGTGCGVDMPFNCIAVCRGVTMTFPDSEALNACPHLRDRKGGAVAAACAPVTFMGRAIGVLHASGPTSAPLTPEQVKRLKIVSVQAGARIGTIRAFEKTQVQASTDGLTGLLNRRAVEQRLRSMLGQRRLFAYILADLDRFKMLNDTHGHQAGDAALRLFSETLRGTVRHGDLVARLGGEEFVIVLADSGAAQAMEWVQRLRGRLAEKLAEGNSIVFTASFGISDSTMSEDLLELQRVADRALYVSKDDGRDRVTIGGPLCHGARQERHAIENPAGIDLGLLAAE